MLGVPAPQRIVAMAKDFIDRLNETIEQVTPWGPQLFSGYNVSAIRKLLVKKIENHYGPSDVAQLSDLLSLGGRRLIKRQQTTDTRHLKRLLLLIHRVLGYHTHAETLALKQSLGAMSQPQLIALARFHIGRGLGFVTKRDSWAREIPMRFGGRLVHYYSQGQDGRLGAIDMTENGWCLGMSVQWLATKRSKQEFWGVHDSDKAAASYRFVMAGQKLRTQHHHGATTADRASFRLKRFGLVKSSTKTEVNDPHGHLMAYNIASAPSDYCRIGQYYKSGGGHAMAAYKDQGRIRFMDPNLGEFEFLSEAEFRQWFPLFTQFMGYVFKRHYIEFFAPKAAPMSGAVAGALTGALAQRRAMLGYDD